MDGEGKVVLIVDDEAGVRRLMSAALEAEGYFVLTASNGKEAVEAVLGNRVDLVVSDVLMPEMDGHELSEALRLCTEIPVLLTSGHQPWLLPSAGLAKAQAFLRKPFEVDCFLEVVRTLTSPAPASTLSPFRPRTPLLTMPKPAARPVSRRSSRPRVRPARRRPVS